MNIRRQNYPVSLRGDVRVQAIPELLDFCDKANKIMACNKAEAFWECESVFLKLLMSSFLTNLVNYELSQSVNDEFYIPTGGGSEIDYSIMFWENFSLVLRIYDGSIPTDNRIYSTTEHYMMGLIPLNKSSSVIIDVFEQTQPYPNEVFERNRCLRAKRKEILYPNTLVKFRAAIDVIRIEPNETPVIMLFFRSPPIFPLRWEYDANTLMPIRVIAGYPESSRLEYTAKLLMEIGNTESLIPLTSLTKHQDHFVRWAAIQAIMALDYEKGFALLCSAREDAHPHIRNAANKVISNLQFNQTNERQRVS